MMMTKLQQVTLLIFVFFLNSCSAQEDQKMKQEDKSQISNFQFYKPKIDPNDVDPYFSGSYDLQFEHAPEVITRHVLQDKTGKMWFATWDGIISYDGEAFTNHTNQQSLRRHRAFCILEASDGDLWFGTIGAGAYRYDGETFQNITAEDGFGSNEVECMMQDDKGNIWFGTGDGVTVYDGKDFHIYTMKDGLLDTDVHSIAQDSKGNIWIASTTGICILDPSQKATDGKVFTELKNEKGKSFNNVRTVMKDSEDRMWFGGNDGLNVYNGGKFTNLSEHFVGYIYESRSGDLWFNKPTRAENGDVGLYKYNRGPLPSSLSKDNIKEVQKTNDMIFGIVEDDEGSIWYGKVNGITKYDRKDFHYFKK